MTTINLFSCVYLSLFALYRLRKKKKKFRRIHVLMHSLYLCRTFIYWGGRLSTALFTGTTHIQFVSLCTGWNGSKGLLAANLKET